MFTFVFYTVTEQINSCKEDALIGEIEVLRTTVTKKTNELEALKSKIEAEKQNNLNKQKVSEQIHDVELKNVKTQLLFKQQELSETRRSYKCLEERYKNIESKLLKSSQNSFGRSPSNGKSSEPIKKLPSITDERRKVEPVPVDASRAKEKSLIASCAASKLENILKFT